VKTAVPTDPKSPEFLALEPHLTAEWFVTELSDEFPWARRHRLLWFVSKGDRSLSATFALPAGKPVVCLSGREGLRDLSTVLVDELGSIPGTLGVEALASAIRWLRTAESGALLCPQRLRGRMPLHAWFAKYDEEREQRFRRYCAPLAFERDERSGRFALEFFYLTPGGAIEKWNVEGTPALLLRAERTEIEPQGSYRWPFE